MSKKKKTPRPEPESLALPRVGVESHAHLDLADYYDDEDFEAAIARAARCGVARIANVFLGPEAYFAGRERFKGREEFFFLCGVHPNDSAEPGPGYLDELARAFGEDERLRAVGEIGLDFYWQRVPEERQERVFRAQLDLARQLERPVVIHSRDADERAEAILLEEGFGGRAVLWHCFGGDADQARRLTGRGWHISVPGTVTFAKNHALREAVAAAGPDRLLLETDCPFLAPEPYRGKRNEPAFLVFTARVAAEALGMEPEELWRTCGENALRFFGLDTA